MNNVFHIAFLIPILLVHASAQSINVTITGGPSSPATLGAIIQYVLTCTAGPNPINVTWITPPAGTVGAQTTSGSTSSRTLTLPPSVQLSNAGLYVCNASANGVTRTTSYAFNVSVSATLNVISMPQPLGSQLQVSCSVSVGFSTDKPLLFMWAGPNGSVPFSGRISANNASSGSQIGGTYIYTSTLTFSTLSSQDNNTIYQCLLGTMYTPYFTMYSSPTSVGSTPSATIVVNALVLTPTISSGTCQQGVLQLNCTAERPLSVVPPLMLSWYRSGTFNPLDSGVPGINVSRTPSGSNTSTLSVSGSSLSGSYVYQCMASVDVPDDVPVVANVTTGVVSFSISGVVSRLGLQSYGQLSRIVWEVPVVNCNVVSYYTVAMTTYSGGTLIEMGTTTDQNYTLTKNYTAGVPYNVTVWALFGTVAGGNTTQTIFTQELAPSIPLSVKTTSINGSTILVSWSPLSPVEARGFVRYYLVTWTPSKARGSPGSANLTADITMYLITGLDPMVSYTISVTPGTSAGVGTASYTTAMPVYPTTVMTTMATPTETCGTLCIIIIAAVGGCVLIIFIVMVIIIITCACLRCRMKHRSVDLTATNAMQLDQKSHSPDQLSGTEINVGERVASYDFIKSQGIPLAEFSAYVATNHQDRDKGFEMMYQAISMECKHPMEAAGFPCNKAKNRFHNISPYDYNRVCLSELEGEEGSDYINASFIDGHNQKNAYIVAQGPMPFTVRDFWRMIWQERVNTIVMLTHCNEGGKRKCEQYWPEKAGESTDPCAGMRVTLNDFMTFADYQTRKMTVTNDGSDELKISHFQFLGWPDHGVPHYSTSLLEFIKRVRNEHRRDGTPLLVHCSAGVGRSGAFIILDYLMQSMVEVVNIEECLANVREQRASMVQTLAQYVFIHDALNELIMCGDTHIGVLELAAKIANMRQADPNTGVTGFQDQFKHLESVCHQPTLNDTSDARQEFNSDKNRYPDRVPNNRDRVRLKTAGSGVQGGGGDYINASFVDGYKSRNAYIAAQAPLTSTVTDFWRMVWEFKCMNIVMLCPSDEQGFCQYWPLRAGESYSIGKLSVSLESLCVEGFSYKLRLKDEKDSTQQLQVTLFHHPGWAEMQCPEDTKPVISIAESVVKAQMQCGGNANNTNKYVTVVCNDGMGRTGAFITIHAMMERLKTEHVVDFFQFIKASRIRRPNFVRSQEQYVYCHEAIADYVEMNGAYANFQDMSKSK